VYSIVNKIIDILRDLYGDLVKTINLRYSSKENLKEFIYKNSIIEKKNLLLQIFTGICNIEFIRNLVEEIKSILPNIKIIGTTTSGEILDGKAETNSTILAFSVFENTKVVTYFAEGEDSSQIAEKLITQFNDNLSAKVAITFTYMGVDGKEYIDTFSNYDKNLIVAGGLAGDNANFTNTIVFTENNIQNNGGVIALLYNEELKVITNACFGWKNIGKTMTITKANKNIVYEIDGEKAIDIYKKYLGEQSIKELVNIATEFPLIIKKRGINIPRAVLAKNDDGSLLFAGSLFVGDKVNFSYGDVQTILNESKTSIHSSESIFIYSCMARLKILGESVNLELLPLANISSVSGFFTYGEFYSDLNLENHELLNQTMTILSLSEGVKQNEIVKTNNKEIIIKDKRNITMQALSHLASQTSKELEEINEVLKEKIEIEVRKNRIKDKIMFQQSKLAQMGEMIGSIAHQWRQPLNTLSINIQKLEFDYEDKIIDNKYIDNFINKNEKTIDFMSKTIDDFRNFFKLDKKRELFKVKEAIKESIAILGVQLVNNDIKIEIIGKEFTNNNFKNEFQQVILNIVNNAKYALIERNIKNKKITIILKDKKIIIKDNAGGIPKDIIDRVFEPYFTTKEPGNGTGIGLYMSKMIIENNMNGKLSVMNFKDCAVFTIYLGE